MARNVIYPSVVLASRTRFLALSAGALALLPRASAHAETASLDPTVQVQKRGSYQLIPPEYAPPADGPELAHAGEVVIYMNRGGGTYTPGVNDSGANRSSVPDQTSTIAPWGVSDAGWQQVMSCVDDKFARWNVEITDVDPGSAPHIESVVAGLPGDLGLEPNVGGVSPFTQDCSVIPNSIVFTFAEVYGSDYERVCEVVAQEVAHSFGLDHEYLCEDPMTYLEGCGSKDFQDTDAQCGEREPRTCLCGQATQNSVALLDARIGRETEDGLAPSLLISHPADGDIVKPGFGVYVEASDDVLVEKVDLLIDGMLITSDSSAPYVLVAPDDLEAGGNYVVETVASDGINESSESIAVTIEGGDGSGSGDGGGTGGGSGTGGAGDQTPENVVGGCSSAPGGGLEVVLLLIAGLVFSRVSRREM